MALAVVLMHLLGDVPSPVIVGAALQVRLAARYRTPPPRALKLLSV